MSKISCCSLYLSHSNVAITFIENDQKDSFEIGGRGELQLGVLIETMRREGFELSVSRPKVLLNTMKIKTN